MRISDWSSDVCSSDLDAALVRHPRRLLAGEQQVRRGEDHPGQHDQGDQDDLPAGQIDHRAGSLRVGSGGACRAARSEEHTSELQSLMRISYAVFCLKKKNKQRVQTTTAHTLP